MNGNGTTEAPYKILYAGYIILPLIAGADKFFHFLVDWNKYLAPQIPDLINVSPQSVMLAVGVIEIAAGLLVAFMPRIGSVVVAAWLLVIIVNLFILGDYYDIVLRDFGLALGALALHKLSPDRGIMTRSS